MPTQTATNWTASVHLSSSSLSAEIADHWQDGFYPFRITAEEGDSTHVNVLWARRPPGISVQARVNLTDAAFADEDGLWRTRGYHLETVDTYVQAGATRRAAVWVRYQPYLRWEGTEFVPGDTSYATKYKMFHDQVLRVMGDLTEVDCSGGQACPAGTGCYTCPPDVPCLHDEVCAGADIGEYTR
ncbi:hypothetical protein, partial [Enhygromyxa salina]|uniref:hypothetical protein n=1 Tax=Enhygromyxa salina TaxID=215803 RepID=UPI0011BA83F5